MALLVTRSLRRYIIGAAAAALITAVAVLSLTGRSRVTSEASVLPTGELALFDGGVLTFADLEGKPLVINFWASWCPACVSELPEFQKVHERLGDDVTFIGFANADRRDAAVALAGEVGLSYILADDPDGSLFRSLDLIAMPTTLFVSADGTVEEVFAGQLTESSLVERVESLQGL